MPNDDWLNPRPELQTDEELRKQLEWAPEHIKPSIREQLGMDPETRKLDLVVRQTETDVKRAIEQKALTDRVIEQRVVEERIADKQLKTADKHLETEKVKRRKEDKPPLADPNSIMLEFAMGDDDEETRLDFLVEPFLPPKESKVKGFSM